MSEGDSTGGRVGTVVTITFSPLIGTRLLIVSQLHNDVFLIAAICAAMVVYEASLRTRMWRSYSVVCQFIRQLQKDLYYMGIPFWRRSRILQVRQSKQKLHLRKLIQMII